MDKQLIEVLRGKSREERTAFFESHKSEILSDIALNAANGSVVKFSNPNSSAVDYLGFYFSSYGYICQGENICT